MATRAHMLAFYVHGFLIEFNNKMTYQVTHCKGRFWQRISGRCTLYS